MPSDYMITTITRADRPNSAQSASGGSRTPNVFMGCKAKVIPYELKCDIAGVVRAFEFVNAADGYLPGGNCMLRARIGHAVLTECGISSRVVCGALLYRVGKHRIRDMLRYCLPDNTGGYYEGYACGHLWIEVDDDIVDFLLRPLGRRGADAVRDHHRSGRWQTGAGGVECRAAGIHLAICTFSEVPWRPRGRPTVGHMWYGPWSSGCSPNYGVYDRLMEETAPSNRGFVADARLRAADCRITRA